MTRRTIARSRHPCTGGTAVLLLLSTTTELFVLHLIPQHDPQSDPEFASDRHSGLPETLVHQFPAVKTLQHRISAYRVCSRLTPEKTHRLPFQVENFILNVKQEHPSWGARKIRERLLRRFSGIPLPAKSTIHAVLDRYGLVERRGRLRRRAQGTLLSLGQRPHELWCTDYKGEFLLGNHQYCYPLTVTDHASRFLLTCEALCSTKEAYAFTAFERLFKERGLPANIRSDNGVPFASAHALFNLSKLAVWWLRLGIGVERIKPAILSKMAVMSACISL